MNRIEEAVKRAESLDGAQGFEILGAALDPCAAELSEFNEYVYLLYSPQAQLLSPSEREYMQELIGRWKELSPLVRCYLYQTIVRIATLTFIRRMDQIFR